MKSKNRGQNISVLVLSKIVNPATPQAKANIIA
jgi:hypothetical protein